MQLIFINSRLYARNNDKKFILNWVLLLIITTIIILLQQMPKNKGRGGKNYKRGKKAGPIKRDLLTKEEDEGL